MHRPAAALAAGLERLLRDATLRARLGGRAVEVAQRLAPEQIRGMRQALFETLRP